MNLRTLLLATSVAALTATAASAQTTYNERHSINARERNQQARIDHGVRDGQITPRGAAAAERNQARISSEEHSMRRADNGHLTAGDRHTLARQQNAASRGIYDRNHNQYTDPGVRPK
jgi:hypothetical protein